MGKLSVVHPQMDYDSVMKRNKTLTPATLWRDLENMMLSERSETHKSKSAQSTYMKHPEGHLSGSAS